MSGQNSSSKTVAAILKQHQDLVAAREITTNQQHQLPPSQQNKKKTKQKTVHKQAHIINHLTAVKNRNIQSSNVASVSQTVNRTSVASVSQQEELGLGKESKPTTTTKASSLSRDLSPSRITAQMKKVMPDPSSAHPNLLLSALQGNMPDPMGLFTPSKPESIMVSTISDVHNTATENWKTTVHSSKSPVDSQLTTTVFSNSLTPVTVFSCPEETNVKSKSASNNSPNLPTVENLLALSAGTIQTINVSHVPKATIPTTSSSLGAVSENTTPGTSSSPSVSTRNAMEVAQQIRMEANGQSASALRTGMQQQLRSQIQGSRSIDAHLASQQNPVTVAKVSSQKAARHEKEQKPLEVSMPLLAAKLAPSSIPGSTAAGSRASLHVKQSTAVGDAPLLLSSLTPSGATAIVVPTSSVAKVSRKSPLQKVSESGNFEEMKKQLQMNKQTSSQVGKQVPQSLAQEEVVLSSSDIEGTLAAVSAAADQIWGLGHGSPRMELSQVSAAFDMHPQLEKMASRSLTSNALLEHTAQTDHASKADGQSQTRNELVSHKLNWNTTLPVRGVNFDQRKTPPDKRVKYEVVEDHRGLGTNQQTSPAMSKYGAGDSKLTAIDVDLDVGHLPSIVAEEAIHISKTVSSAGQKMHANLSVVNVKDSFPATSHFLQSSHIPISVNNVSGSSSVPSTMAAGKSLSDASASMAGEVKLLSGSSPFVAGVSPMHSAMGSSSLPRSNPVMFSAAPMSSSSSHTGMASSNPPAYESSSLPPPYSHPAHSFAAPDHHRHNPVSGKDSNHNPFTFPTSGLTVISDSSGHGFTAFALRSGTGDGPARSLPEGRLASTVLSKAHSDTSALNHSHKHNNSVPTEAIPRLVPEASVKLEELQGFNHIQEAKMQDELLPIQPFNQRISNLSCFPVMNSTYRAAYRSHAVAVQRARAGVIMSTAKSLDVLRQNLQRNINKEISEIIKRYTDKYFQPALENIRLNNNEGSLGDEHINYVCRQILEEAKSEYMSMSGRRSATPSDIPDNVSDSGSTSGRRTFLKRGRISDSDSERGSDGGFKRKTVKRKGRPPVHSSGRATPSKQPVKREGPRWDPVRLKPDTLFVMGARANKALGLGNTRGRLYIRHPEVFKYVGDQEDKLWLYEHNLMPAAGGKAYMLLLEDIEELSRTDEYKDSPSLMMHECVGFTVPEWMLVKMKTQMNALRSDKKPTTYSSPGPTEAEEKNQKILPFSSFTEVSIKDEPQLSPADTEMDFLSTADNEDTQPSSAVSPFTVTGGFEDGTSPSPSDLDPIEETSGHHLFS
ncbi:uncharacterized protein LOC101855298 [Aplysia californica]|uniref:Uncharacterized protein LOC101855298 n=1 Tax=Aplysia californica TaxID=6500 RepID=A0ABM0K6Y7_APLCA|nr:uncharacterized protein LOC101855298 [Aplysia californica]XP_005110187.1 uncharacterized protein LOC101855298 [Aplysia californica]XP_005110188.1 uncharacterized protein LOC101855298 [Aplysia californica]